MDLKKRNQLIVQRQEAKSALKRIYPRLELHRAHVRHLEQEYGRHHKAYKDAQQKLSKVEVNYIPMGQSSKTVADAESKAVAKFSSLPKEKQLELIEFLEKGGE